MFADTLNLLYLVILISALSLAVWILAVRRRSRRALVVRVRELTLLSEVGRAIVSAELDVDRLADLIYKQAAQIVDTRFFQVGLFEGDCYRTVIWVRDGERAPNVCFTLAPGSEGIVGWMRHSRQPLLVRDFETELDSLPAKPRYLSTDPPRSAIFVPLIARDEAIGGMAIQSRVPRAFTENDLHMLAIIANQVSAALANAILFGQTRTRARELGLIAEVSRRISTIQPLPDLFRQVVTMISETFGYYAVNVFELAGERLELRASSSAEFASAPRLLELGEGVVGRAAARRAPEVVVSVGEDSGYVAHEAFARTESELAVPLKIEDEVLGVLDVQSDETGAFPPETVRVMESLAAQLSIAVLESRNYDSVRRRADQLAVMVGGASAVASVLDLDDLLDEVMDLVEEHLGYERASIFLAEGDRLVFRAGIGGGSARWLVQGLSFSLSDRALITKVARTGLAVLAPDVSREPDYRVAEGLEDTRSEVAVPLVMAGRVLGVFDVQSPEIGRLGEEDLQVLQTLAGSLSVAVRNARLFAAERRRRALAEIMRDVATALVSTLDLGSVLQRILAGLARLVTFDAAAILLAEEPGSYVIRAASGARLPSGLVGQVVELREPGEGEPNPPVLNFETLDPLGDYHRLLGHTGPHTCVGATLMAGNAVSGRLGYLVVDRMGTTAGHEMQVEEMELITAFASQASVAIDNAALFTSQREEAWVSTALLQVAEASARADRLDDVLSTAARLTSLLVGVDHCAVLLRREDVFVLAAFHPDSERERALESAPHAVGPAEWPPLAELERTRAAVVVEPDEPLPPALLHTVQRGEDVTGVVMILLPLLVRGEVAGAMLVGQAPEAAAFTEQRIRLLGGIADQVALAIERAMLRESWQEEAWVSMALLQVAEVVASQPILNQSLEAVARLIPLLAGVRWAAIYKYDAVASVLLPETYSGFEGEQIAGFFRLSLLPERLGLMPISPGEAEVRSDSATPLALPSLTPDDALADVFGQEAFVALPLRAHGEFLGALAVDDSGQRGRRMNLLNGFAHQLSLAIVGARLAAEVVQQQRLEREVEVARGIQASFLPESCPLVPGWDVCSYWKVARQVGGDFYDFVQLPHSVSGHERWGVVIADVADKGVPAALFMALSRTLIRATALAGHSPGETLRQVNDLILADTRSDLFVTVFYLVWEPETGRVEYAVGGHNPPVFMPSGGEAHTLPGKGPALGVIPVGQYRTYELTFGPGDVLLLYTDGVTEAINAHEEEFGMARLMQVSASAHKGRGGATELVDAVAGAVAEHARGLESFDDMTLVVIKRNSVAV